MRRDRSERLRQWGTGALLLFLASSLGSARTAWASCNHLAVSTSDRLAGLSRLDSLILFDGSATIVDGTVQDPLNRPWPKRPTPCSGPSCSNRVPMPAPTAFPESDRSDQWVVVNSMVFLSLASPPCRTVGESAARPGGERPSIFHPPPARASIPSFDSYSFASCAS
jgi:hypothetical protein